MRLLSLDYGTQSIGVAVSDELRLTVRPLTTIRGKGWSRDALVRRVREIVAEYEPVALVVGLPLRMDGTAGDAARRVQDFVAELRRELPIPVVTQDERLTSREADEMMREQGLDARERRARSDEFAAAVILRDYLASHPADENLIPPGDIPAD
jgi:putative holliday junction resolvase